MNYEQAAAKLREAGQEHVLKYYEELTPRQKQMLELYFDQGMNMPQIARALDLNRSTVSRTLRRARERLYRCLRYTL